jgi:uncharacterized protein (DUF2236 family)
MSSPEHPRAPTATPPNPPMAPIGSPALATPGFQHGQPIRRIGGEPVMFLGAQRALLLQIAHPLVGAAVDDHSTFRRLPVRRLWATADTMLLMVWGRGGEPATARRRIMAIHDGVRGALPDAVGPHDVDTPYSAHDPRLLRWVWGTLVETMVAVHVRWLGPLDHRARADLLDDWRRFATFFGLPASSLPPTWMAFKDWFLAEQEQLAVGPAARRVSQAILDPPLWFVPRTVKQAYALIAAGLLPPDLRAAYGIAWSDTEQTELEEYDHVIRAFWAQAPAWRREVPYAYLAARRGVTRTAAKVSLFRRT